jgi:hypothetical protein
MMKYLLSMPKSQYERINNYFAEPSAGGKAAFLLTNVDQNQNQCQIDVSEFFAADDLKTESQIAGFSIQSPLMMDAIDRAMETCKSFLFLYSDPAPGEDGADPMRTTTNQIVFRIAYHYLPSGLHACMAYKDSKFYGAAWLKDDKPQPLQIQIKAS